MPDAIAVLEGAPAPAAVGQDHRRSSGPSGGDIALVKADGSGARAAASQRAVGKCPTGVLFVSDRRQPPWRSGTLCSMARQIDRGEWSSPRSQSPGRSPGDAGMTSAGPVTEYRESESRGAGAFGERHQIHSTLTRLIKLGDADDVSHHDASLLDPVPFEPTRCERRQPRPVHHGNRKRWR